MADKTQNFGLTKPLTSEFYDVGVQNSNMDKIDAALQEHDLHAKDGTRHVTAAEKAGWNGKVEPSEVATAMNAHNTGQAAHPDMRTAIEAAQNAADAAQNAADAAQNAADAAHAHTGAAVTTETGVHGLRVYDGKLQMQKTDGSWEDASASGGLLPTVQVTTTAGATVRCTMGDTTLEAVAGTDGAAAIEIPAYGTWTVRAEKSGYSPTQTVIDVDTCKVYSVALEFLSATITVTTRPNASVRAMQGGRMMSATADSTGIAVFHPTISGAYNVTASVVGNDMAIVTSETVSVTVENGGSYNVTCAFIELAVQVDSSASIQVACGDTKLTGTSIDGMATFLLPKTGNWTVTATKDSKVATQSVNITAYEEYSVVLRFYKYYGVQIDLSNTDPEAAVTYIGDAASHTAGYVAWKNDILIGSIRPCAMLNGELVAYLDPNKFSQKADGTALGYSITNQVDVMVEIPKMGYKIVWDGGYIQAWVTNDPQAEGYCYLAHSLRTEGDCNEIYIGAYLASYRNDGLHSFSGATPLTNVSLNQARTYATGRGDGFQLLSFYPVTLLQCLYLIIYKNLNGQAAIGYGYSPGNSVSSARTTGGTDNKGMCFGESTGQHQMKFLGLEDFWGNAHQWVDGLYCDADYSIRTAYTDFEVGGEEYPIINDTGMAGSATDAGVEGWVSDVIGNNEGGFTMTAVDGSSSTFFCDNSKLVAGRHAYYGGNWNYGLACGPFRMVVAFGATASGSSIGARLLYKKEVQVL